MNRRDFILATAAFTASCGRKADDSGTPGETMGVTRDASLGLQLYTVRGTVPYDKLLAGTEPERVEMQLDLAWAQAGNADALAYFEAWPGRFPLFHLKDFDAGGEEADIGSGSVAFAAILERAELAGLEHGFVERDHADDVRASVKRNYDAILPLWRQYMPSDNA